MTGMKIQRVLTGLTVLFLAYVTERVGERLGRDEAEQRHLAALRANASNIILPAAAFGTPVNVHVYRRNVYRDAAPGIQRAFGLAGELVTRFQAPVVVQLPEGSIFMRQPVHIRADNAELRIVGASQPGAEPSTISAVHGVFVFEAKE